MGKKQVSEKGKINRRGGIALPAVPGYLPACLPTCLLICS